MERHDLRHAFLVVCAAAACVGPPQAGAAAEPQPPAGALQTGLRFGEVEQLRAARVGTSAWGAALRLVPGWQLNQESPPVAHRNPDLLGASRALGGERAAGLASGLAAHRRPAPGRRLELLPGSAGLERRGALRVVLGVTVKTSASAMPVQPEGYKDVTDRRMDTFAFGGIGGRFDM